MCVFVSISIMMLRKTSMSAATASQGLDINVDPWYRAAA